MSETDIWSIVSEKHILSITFIMAYEEIGHKGKNMLINYSLLDYSSPGGCISQAHKFYIYLYIKDLLAISLACL